MNRNVVLLTALLFAVSFSAGLFTEFLVSPDNQALAALSGLSAGIIKSLKSDALTVVASAVFSSTVVLLPAVLLLILGKMFSLGFAAAYLLHSGADHGFGILLAALLPRGICKVPAYLALLAVSVQTAMWVHSHARHPHSFQSGLLPHLAWYLLCFLALAASSLLEACLLQVVL